MDSFHVNFGPCDPLNPEIGYQIEILKNGESILFTSKDPLIGEDLDFEGCIDVLKICT